MLAALIWLWMKTPAPHSFDIQALYSLNLSATEQSWIFWAFFLAFAIKMPVFPFHTWQPDTYTDSPTPGTMLLSGIMLKMGVYGVLRWLLPIVPSGVHEWGNTAMILSVISVVYASGIALVQKDFKRLIAYSSIAHVGLISAGVFSLTMQGIQGGVIQMLSHGINVVGLFSLRNYSWQNEDKKFVRAWRIRLVAPAFANVFHYHSSCQCSSSTYQWFHWRILLLNGVFQYSTWMAAAAGLTIILGAVYMLTAYQKISLG